MHPDYRPPCRAGRPAASPPPAGQFADGPAHRSRHFPTARRWADDQIHELVLHEGKSALEAWDIIAAEARRRPWERAT